MRVAAVKGYVVLPSEGTAAEIQSEARRIAGLLDEDAEAITSADAPLERWCSSEVAAPIDLRSADGDALRGAVIGIRLRGDVPRIDRAIVVR
jgi:hypothetical protein